MTWEQAWLAYDRHEIDLNDNRLNTVFYDMDTERIESASAELKRGLEAITGASVDLQKVEDIEAETGFGIYLSCAVSDDTLGEEGYEILGNDDRIVIQAVTDKGIVYGAFAFLRSLITEEKVESVYHRSVPENPYRMLNHWDNSDGSIERGYSGRSFFFKDGEIIVDERTKDYARLIASIGINGVVINNVNVASDAIEFITDRYYDRLNQLIGIFDAYGIKMYLSLDYAAPIDIGGLDSSDPLEPEVIDWWSNKMAEVYKAMPKLGGFLIKADSEGRPGPFTYGRKHADGGNMLGKAVAPYGGIIIWRCFVYNCRQDWRDRKIDRARAGYDHFMPLDGQFDDNVILQIKNGPMDFQVREPVSPLLGAMPRTNQILEFQIAQEYTGQQRHVCYLIPMWKEILNFKTGSGQNKDAIKDLTAGRTYDYRRCGISAVTNTGNEENWTGHDLAGANLYGYGRLIWDMDLTSEAIAEEWIRMTYGNESAVVNNIRQILMMSWPAYEKYTSPLGIGWMVNPSHHYGPNIEGYEYDRWGTYHFADCKGVGVDRTDDGTGYARQYFDDNYRMYNSVDTCPEELLLFFHHIPYNHVLSTGKTLIQHIYDAHFEGAGDVEHMMDLWQSVQGKVPAKAYERTCKRFEHQIEHSKEWRDRVNTYFYRMTLVADEKGRTIY